MNQTNQLRIVLSSEASARLSAMGERCFTIATRQAYPADPARWVLYLRAVDAAVVDGACRVLSGEFRAVPIANETEAESDLLDT